MRNKRKKYNWCAYGIFSYKVGKVLRYNPASVDIQYNEDQTYPSQIWGRAYVQLFPTIKQAFDFCLKNNDMSKYKLLQYTREDFKEAKRLRLK